MRQNATLSEFEEMEIRAKALAEGKDPQKELERALQKKWDQFDRRASGVSCQLIRERVIPEMLAKLKAGDAQALEEARFLVNEVSKANFKKLVKNVLLVIIAIIGILAFVGALVFSGPFAPILFAIAAGLWILVDSKWAHEKSSDLLWALRNKIWPEWSYELKRRVCPPPPPSNSSITSAPRKDFLPTPSRRTAATSARLRNFYRTYPGLMWEANTFSPFLPISRKRDMRPHRFAALS
jgi:hypothetical protein